MKLNILQLLFISVFISFWGCKKDKAPETPANGMLQINIEYKFDESALRADTLIYTNAAGYKMSVTKLNYYLSGITFYSADSSKTTVPDVHYSSLSDSASNHFSLSVPRGNYVALKFYIGLDSIHNQTGALPSTPSNINMAWPDMMGGGYHFLKLEGYYLDKSGKNGYTVHLGKNSHLVTTKVISKTITVNSEGASIKLNMNIAEWLKNPYTYDFNLDGNYTMSNDTAMAKIVANGFDVFN